MTHTPFQRWILVAILILGGFIAFSNSVTFAQNADAIADEVLRESPSQINQTTSDGVTTTSARINWLELILTAPLLMLPIVIMSIVVVAVGIERAIGLRRQRVLPTEIVDMVQESTKPGAAFSPKRMYKQCSAHPSPLSNVVKSVLVKLGRPTPEVERIASETIQRESDRLYRNVRWLNLAASVTPLVGLLGTVFGMITAFFATANLPVGANKAEHLAEGIYTALITTAGGLVVAIPAAILAHMFEGQIEKLFLDVHEIVYTRMMPQAERLEGHSSTEEPRSASMAKLKTSPPPPSPSGSGTSRPGIPPVQPSTP